MENVKLVEETEISWQAIKYLQEMESKFGGIISRGFMQQDYLTSPKDGSDFDVGRDDCLKHHLIKKADDGSSYSYIKHKITERGYTVLELVKNGDL